MLATLVVFLLFVFQVNAITFNSNNSDIEIFVNHLSSCNYNKETKNMVCVSLNYNTIVQFHNVKDVAMCDYHYCILYDNQVDYSCSGYTYTLIGGSMQTHINPLSVNVSNVGIISEERIPIGTLFLGYNIIIDYFVQNVVNLNSSEYIKSISCGDKYSTKINYLDNTSIEFGANNIVFHGTFESLILGSLIHSAFACFIYLILFCFSKSTNYMLNFMVVPIMTIMLCYLILFVAERFIVKVFAFVLSSLCGILVGYLMAQTIYTVSSKFFRDKETSKVTDENTKFTIDDDSESGDEDEEVGSFEGTTEIELSGKTHNI